MFFWASAPRMGRFSIRTGERTYRNTENPPIRQDFVPYRGRCPASPSENQGSRAELGNHLTGLFKWKLNNAMLIVTLFFVSQNIFWSKKNLLTSLFLSLSLSNHPTIQPSVSIICIHMEVFGIHQLVRPSSTLYFLVTPGEPSDPIDPRRTQ